MLIPISGEFDRKAIPKVTIFLLLANLAVFFAFQLDDNRLYREAQQFYIDSGLARIEYAFYQSYRQDIPVQKTYAEKTDFEPEPEDLQRISRMQRDGAFQAWLRKTLRERDRPPSFDTWQGLRREFEAKLQRVTSYAYGLIPSHPEPLDWISSLFLHGGVGHLLGNMLFLWLAGFLLESGCGSLRFTAFYLFGGLAACLLFTVFNRNLAVPLIGASGAIAGIVGAMSVVYGLRRIKVFLTLGFYFNYFRMPAILLLPVWMGKEVISLVRTPESQVAFLAHIGGLAGGALLGLAVGRLSGFEPGGAREATEPDPIAPSLERAMASMRQLDFAAARQSLEEALRADPENLTALRQLYRIEKQTPTSVRLPAAANRLLAALLRRNDSAQEILEVYKEYRRLTKGVRLNPRLAARLIRLLIDAGELSEAERLLALLLRKDPGHSELPSMLLRLAAVHGSRGDGRRASSCLGLLLKRFPDSQEASHARRLRSSSREDRLTGNESSVS